MPSYHPSYTLRSSQSASQFASTSKGTERERKGGDCWSSGRRKNTTRRPSQYKLPPRCYALKSALLTIASEHIDWPRARRVGSLLPRPSVWNQTNRSHHRRHDSRATKSWPLMDIYSCCMDDLAIVLFVFMLDPSRIYKSYTYSLTQCIVVSYQ